MQNEDQADPRLIQTHEVIEWLLGLVTLVPPGFIGCVIVEKPTGFEVVMPNGQVFNVVVGEITPLPRAVRIPVKNLRKSDLDDNNEQEMI